MRGRAALGLCVAALCAPASASATVYTVNTQGDHNDQTCSAVDCTLREALAAAGGNDEVHLPTGTYALVASLGELDFDRDTLVGTNARATIIRAGTGNRVVRVLGEAPSEISGVTLTGGAPTAAASAPEGGGILIEVGASLTLLDSTVSGNTATAGGGIGAFGTLTIARSTVSGNVASTGVGGGIALYGGVAGTLTNTTVSGNRAEARSGFGAGIYTLGTLTLDSVTVASNRATTGGGLYQPSVAGGPTPVTTIRDTIVAGNSGGNCAGDAAVIAAWQGNHNLAQDGTCGFTATGDKPNTNPLLGALANNGGPTNTHAIAPPSPAINAGDPANCSIRDQRGVTRGLRACDIGAFEYVAPTTPGGGGGLPDPVFHRNVNALPESGTVKIKLPGQRRFRVLSQGEQIPLGTTVDVRRGRVTIVAAAGGDQQADFYDGIFKLTQTKGSKPITVLRLVEKLTCKQASTAARKKRKRRLWGDGKGRFRTKGKHSAATVVGTKWLVEDRCTSTLTRVRRGRVKVRDFGRHKTVTVRAPHKYVAKKRA